MSLNGKLMESLLEFRVGDLLRRQQLKVAVAESCTGGLIGHRLTNIPGSSDYYLGSVVTYSLHAKERWLGVQPQTLAAHGAVSRETALEMACGIRTVFSVDFGLNYLIGLSITGIAGPGGALPGKPVGTAWVGLSTPEGDQALPIFSQGSRVENKTAFAEQALLVLINHLEARLRLEK